jgi:Xaa-Pro aminopeptidase
VIGESSIHVDNVVQYIKALKNPVEQEGMRKVNIKNCASLVQFFAWMEEHLKTNPQTDMTEYTAA